jgi:hypothetical protein
MGWLGFIVLICIFVFIVLVGIPALLSEFAAGYYAAAGDLVKWVATMCPGSGTTQIVFALTCLFAAQQVLQAPLLLGHARVDRKSRRAPLSLGVVRRVFPVICMTAEVLFFLGVGHGAVEADLLPADKSETGGATFALMVFGIPFGGGLAAGALGWWIWRLIAQRRPLGAAQDRMFKPDTQWKWYLSSVYVPWMLFGPVAFMWSGDDSAVWTVWPCFWIPKLFFLAVFRSATLRLDEHTDAWLRAVCRKVTTGQPGEQISALYTLGTIGSKGAGWAATVIRPILDALQHRDPVVRALAVTRVSQIMDSVLKPVKGSVDALRQSPNSIFRNDWLKDVSKNATQVAELSSALVKVANDPDPDLAHLGSEAFNRVDELVDEAKTVLQRALSDKDSSVRQSAQDALTKLGLVQGQP